MKKEWPAWITYSIAAIAVICLISALNAAAKQKAAEKEASALRDQVARMEAYVPDMDATVLSSAKAESIGTNDVSALRSQMAKKDAELVKLKAEPENTAEQERPQRESWEDRMARMKEEEPEEYADMVKRRQERQQEMRYKLAERTATFMDLDTSNMTDEERANHDALVEKMATVWELTAQFQDPEAAPDRDAMRELFTEMNEARPLMKQERTVMFKQLGSDLGYEGEDAQDFAAHVEDIINATTLQSPGRGGRGGGGNRGGGNRGGGAR